MEGSFYNDMDLRYPEIGILVEDYIGIGKAKVMIPILMPRNYSEDAVETTVILDSTKTKVSNYVQLTIPSYMHTGALIKGTKVIVVFIGGELSIECIKIIGIIED